jgi:alkanesulfonate monooxygenase SsuD/methylene tetrahydromethanopterin reductase-like flavin-dependent oxidoreductase (luciferase family)
VFWLQHHSFIKRMWDKYGELYEEHHAERLGAGDKRMLVISVRVGDSREEAMAAVRPGHDEFWKFLGPYGWSRGYMGVDGAPAAPGLIPTLEESIDNKTWLVGTAADVAEGLGYYRDILGGLDNLTIFPNMPGDRYADSDEQMVRFAEEVLPLL